MAAHHHADPDRGPDRRLWPADARLRHREAAARIELAKHLAARTRHDDRHPHRRDAVDPDRPDLDRFGVGVLLVAYSIYSLVRPPLGPFKIGAPADIAIGVTNGLVGGLTGLGGIISTISCQFRGWPRDKQRAVFQPVLFAAFVIISVSQLVAGSYTTETVKLYGIGLPFMVAGIWIGFKLYGTINDETFRKTVLILVLLAGVSLVVSSGLMPR